MEAFLMVRAESAFAARIAGAFVAAIAATAVIAPTPTAAEGLFDFFFGGLRRLGPSSSTSSYADPNSSADGRSGGSGLAGTFCVRLCDGRYFPIQRAANAAQMCSSFCPASQTKVFSGGGIDQAIASDGSRYASLRNAFAYRERVVENCTCNGRDAYGLVTPGTVDDPTLRPGDIVATNEGFVAYTGPTNRRSAEFTPIQSYTGLPAEWRERLAQTRITPSNATPIPPDALRDSTASIPDDRNRRVQLER
jgi:uncharacterized protein DUF2865